jgi:hypothetical protein
MNVTAGDATVNGSTNPAAGFVHGNVALSNLAVV